MKTPKDDLLTDILGDFQENHDLFRTQQLELWMRCAARRRLGRRIKQGALVVSLAGLLLSAAFLVPRTPPSSDLSRQDSHIGNTRSVTRLKPLDSPSPSLSLAPSTAVPIVDTIPNSVTVFETPISTKFYREIGDDQLVEQFAPQAVVLVRLTPSETLLVLPEEESQLQ